MWLAGDDIAIRLRGVGKRFRLGEAGRDTLREDLAYRRAVRRGQPVERPREFWALRDVDLDVRCGETVGLVGRNGAGKSTLLKLVSRITAPSEGEIDVWGRVASMLEVGTGFHGDLTGRENVYMNGAIMGMSRAEIRAKMDDIIEFSEIGDFIDTPVKRYSSGMFVRLGFAVAAHLESEILLMDEVLAVGDAKFQRKCLEKMRSLARDEGRTAIYVSHNMGSVRDLCDRCVVLSQGGVGFDGGVSEGIAHYLYLGDDDRLCTTYEFGDESRPYVRTEQQADDFWLRSLVVEGVGEPLYDTGDVPHVTVRCESAQARPGVGLRLETWYQDGSKVGSMLSDGLVDLPAGSSDLSLALDLSQLTEGQYRADLVAYQILDDGSEHVLDRVYPGMLFAVRSMGPTMPFNGWKNQYWGNVRLADMRLGVL